jgi:uncharacterized membrane protein
MTPTISQRCPVCQQSRPADELQQRDRWPASISAILAQRQVNSQPLAIACAVCINDAKAEHMEQMLQTEMGTLSTLEQQVIESIRKQTLLSVAAQQELERPTILSDQWADRIARLVGSWRFSGLILLYLALWIGINILFQPFEPYPSIIFAVIGATLGSLAALHGPIIMMSQRHARQQERLQTEIDYRVNLKAELEIRYLNEKIDQLLAQAQELAPRK